jgi:hypothetical protein
VSELPSTVSAATGSEPAPEIDRTLEALLADMPEPQGEVDEQVQLQNSKDAFDNILSSLGMNSYFKDRVSYREGAQCTGNFQTLEASWRPYFDSFTDVQRAPADRDVAYLVAKNSNYSAPATVGATQYRGYPAVSLRGDEPSVALAASLSSTPSYGVTRRALAHNLALTSKEYGEAGFDGETAPAVRYETPSLSYFHFLRHPRYRHYNKGVLAVHNKRDQNDPGNLRRVGLFV